MFPIAGLALSLSVGLAIAADLYIVDGDTVHLGREKIRLTSDAGPIDAPEIYARGFRPARCELELERARTARDRLREMLASGDWSIDRRGRDGHERSLAVIYAEGEDVGARMVREGHARPWPRPFKRNKPDWCRP